MDPARRELLRDVVATIEDIDQHMAELREQKAEAIKRASDKNLDAKALRRVLALRKMKSEARRRHTDLVDQYLHALDELPLEVEIERQKAAEEAPLVVHLKRGRRPAGSGLN